MLPGGERRAMQDEREFDNGDVVPGTRYRVVSLIGTGGMGSVYEVEHSELYKRFVLKALRRTLTTRDDLVRRLRTEWRALGRLEHRNIVSVTDAGVTATGAPFYVMERLQGETLSARLRRERRLPIPDALNIAIQVLEGLSAAHRIQVVHRDVKPPNVFLVNDGGVKLLDFGIAKITEPGASQITGRGVTLGTPRYMAPEQASGDPVGPHTDLYAVGLVLYEMIAGSGPFDACADSDALYLAQLTRSPPPLELAAPGVSPELSRIVASLLEKTTAKRPASAEAAAALLGAELMRPRKEDAERTVPGTPSGCIEAADTVSAQPRTRTLVVRDAGSTLPVPAGDEGPTERLEPSSGGEAGIEDGSEPESETRTAVPAVADVQETPPPVERALVRVGAARSAVRVGATAFGLVALGAGVYLASSWLIRGSAPSPTGRAVPARDSAPEARARRTPHLPAATPPSSGSAAQAPSAPEAPPAAELRPPPPGPPAPRMPALAPEPPPVSRPPAVPRRAASAQARVPAQPPAKAARRIPDSPAPEAVTKTATARKEKRILPASGL